MASSRSRSPGSASHATSAPPASARISAVSARKSFSRSSIAVPVRPKSRRDHAEQWLRETLPASAQYGADKERCRRLAREHNRAAILRRDGLHQYRRRRARGHRAGALAFREDALDILVDEDAFGLGMECDLDAVCLL